MMVDIPKSNQDTSLAIHLPMLLLSRDSEYRLEAVLVKSAVPGSRKTLDRFLENSGLPPHGNQNVTSMRNQKL
jgi:hypothetical protein